jgi:dTDP-4-dehydrorhamnose 3,5-epimerase-like enzyme
MMVHALELAGVFEIIPRKFGDDRGFSPKPTMRNHLPKPGLI